MEVATAAQPPSRHQNRYVPIVAGTLGGCGLALIVGCLLYLFLRMRRRGLGQTRRAPAVIVRQTAYRPLFERHAEPNWRIASPQVSFCDMCRFPPRYDPTFQAGFFEDWNSTLDLSGLSELPFADVDFQTNFDFDYHNLDTSTLQASSDLEPSHDRGFPLNIGLGPGNSVDGDSYLSVSRALPFVNFDLQTNFDLDPQDPNAFAVPANLDLGPSHGTDSLVGSNNSNKTSQQGMSSNPLPAPFAPPTIPSNDQPLSSLWTNVEHPGSHPDSQASQKLESLPLPPAPTLRCPNCPRKLSSRVRLE